MIKFKLGQFEILRMSLAELGKIQLPVKTSYKLTRFISKTFDIEYSIYSEERTRICKEYSEKDKDNNPIIENKNFKIAEDRKKEFEEKMKEYYDNEIELNFMALTIDELGTNTISSNLLLALQTFEIVES